MKTQITPENLKKSGFQNKYNEGIFSKKFQDNDGYIYVHFDEKYRIIETGIALIKEGNEEISKVVDFSSIEEINVLCDILDSKGFLKINNMKKIKERAEEYAKSVINSTDDQLMTNDEIMRCAEHDFTIGAEFGYQLCNAELKEKKRWIHVDERLPETKNESYYVEVKYREKMHKPDFQYISYLFSEKEIMDQLISCGFTHWREIIE